MADQDGGGSLPWPALMAFFLAVGSASLYLAPLKTNRPTFASSGTRSLGNEDVDARLWQDPFQAAETARKRQGRSLGDADAAPTDGDKPEESPSTGELGAEKNPPDKSIGVTVKPPESLSTSTS